MSDIFVHGLGVVSPAGWGLAAFRSALERGVPLPTAPLNRPELEKPLTMRSVPSPAAVPEFLFTPRLRRTSPITHYSVAAALEALGTATPKSVGLVMCQHTGCVQYSYRFFEETLKDPTTASPVLFPETVLAAPVSHVAAMLPNVEIVQTFVGDPATFLQGMALAANWLLEERVELALVIGAEETNWLLADAIWSFDHHSVMSGGAGAICISRHPSPVLSTQLQAITNVHSYQTGFTRADAARAMRLELAEPSANTLLCDGLQGCSRTDAPEAQAWLNWSGLRLSPKRILGESLSAAAAWQCVAACDALASNKADAAFVSLVGCNQQAIGARFVRVP